MRAGTARKNRSIAADSPPPGGRQKTRGQSLVEFALILPLFVVIFALAADFGRAFSAYIAISGAAREGAIYAAINTGSCDGTDTAANAETSSIWGDPTTVGCTTGVDSFGYDWVEVTVSYTFEPLLPVGPIPSSIAMDRVVRMRVVV